MVQRSSEYNTLHTCSLMLLRSLLSFSQLHWCFSDVLNPPSVFILFNNESFQMQSIPNTGWDVNGEKRSRYHSQVFMWMWLMERSFSLCCVLFPFSLSSLSSLLYHFHSLSCSPFSLHLPLHSFSLPPPPPFLPLSLPLLHLAEAKCLVWDNITVGNSACVARLLSFLPRAGNNVCPS